MPISEEDIRETKNALAKKLELTKSQLEDVSPVEPWEKDRLERQIIYLEMLILASDPNRPQDVKKSLDHMRERSTWVLQRIEDFRDLDFPEILPLKERLRNERDVLEEWIIKIDESLNRPNPEDIQVDPGVEAVINEARAIARSRQRTIAILNAGIQVIAFAVSTAVRAGLIV